MFPLLVVFPLSLSTSERSVTPALACCALPGDLFANHNALARTGFHGMCQDTDDMFHRLFQTMREQRVIPSGPATVAPLGARAAQHVVGQPVEHCAQLHSTGYASLC